MIEPTHLIEAFARNVNIIKMQTKDLTQAESLIQLPFRANCMNWTVGHIAASRNSVLKLLGEEPAFPPDSAARYLRESDPITAEDEHVLPLEEILAHLDRSQEQIAAGIARLAPEEFSRELALFGNRKMAVAGWLLFFHFHDTYHTGQTEILRQAAGKDDKVI